MFLAKSGGGHDSTWRQDMLAVQSRELVASAQQHAAASEGHADQAVHHEGTAPWLKRIITTLWMNNVFFAGLGIIGLFFVAIQYAAQAGWSVGVKRVGLAMGTWIPIAGIINARTVVCHKPRYFPLDACYLYRRERQLNSMTIINKKAPFFFWPLGRRNISHFFHLQNGIVLRRMVLVLYHDHARICWRKILKPPLHTGIRTWFSPPCFLIFFGVSSSIAAWDWVMSIDTHWFSTMFGWYVFASWWVTGLGDHYTDCRIPERCRLS